MPDLNPEQLVSENREKIFQAYESKGCKSELSLSTGEEETQCMTAKDSKADHGQALTLLKHCESEVIIKQDKSDEEILHLITIRSYITQIGKGNVMVRDSIEYQKSSSGTETSISVQKETKNIPTENTDVESEDESKQGRKYVYFDHKLRRSEAKVAKVDTSSESECAGTRTKSKQKKKRRVRKRDEDETVSIVVHKSMQPPDPSESYIEFCRISDDVMMRVQILRDNGRWEEFLDAVESVSREYTSLEAQIVISLEKSMAACYQNNLEESKKMIMEAIHDAKDTENCLSLTARAHYYLSGVYRRMPHLTGKADKCLHIAEQNLDNKSLTLDTTFADYERGSVLMDFLAQIPNNSRSKLKENAKMWLKKCIDGSVKLEQDVTTKRYIKKHHFAYIKIALLNLDCRMAAGRKKDQVSTADIQEAKDCLETLKNRYWDGIAQGEQVQYYIAMADLSWRQKDMGKAESFALEAYNMATTFGFKTEIKPAQERLEDIRVKIQDMSGERGLEPRLGVVDDVGSVTQLSDSDFGDVSSSGSDSLCSPLF